jgi:hypothetical protein
VYDSSSESWHDSEPSAAAKLSRPLNDGIIPPPWTGRQKTAVSPLSSFKRTACEDIVDVLPEVARRRKERDVHRSMFRDASHG